MHHIVHTEGYFSALYVQVSNYFTTFKTVHEMEGFLHSQQSSASQSFLNFCNLTTQFYFRFYQYFRTLHMYTVSQKSEPPKHFPTATTKFYTHKTTSIFVIDVKFHKNLLFRFRDVQFLQTAVTNLSYRYNLLLADVICGDRCDVSAC